MENEIAATVVKLKKTGDLVITEDNVEIVVAHYDRTSGHLEYMSQKYSVDLHNQVTSKIGTVSKGAQPSGLVIRSVGVKGMARIDPKLMPRRPKLGAAGDAAEDVVQWYLDNNMPEAIIKYGIYLDAKGNPVRKTCHRVFVETVDRRDSNREIPWTVDEGTGGKMRSRSPIAREGEMVEFKAAIIARRATPLTFTPEEVVGGWQPDDDYEIQRNADEEGAS